VTNAIVIHDLRIETRIGVYEWEKRIAQTIRLDIELGLPSDKVFVTGDFADALDYAAVVKRLQAFAANHSHQLLECFAQAIADVLMGEFSAPWVKVRVAKLAPIAGVRELGVVIERSARDARQAGQAPR
jgi:7,8-dihydroneopterin aldolase/epimerase/oxygenase